MSPQTVIILICVGIAYFVINLFILAVFALGNRISGAEKIALVIAGIPIVILVLISISVIGIYTIITRGFRNGNWKK